MKFVDLFAGCGGLSLGLERAGGELVFAVEKSDMAARTYYHNNIASARSDADWASYLRRDIRDQAATGVVVRPLEEVLSSDDILRHAAAEHVDLVVGGPPCQGFSMAGRRNKDDVRNRLAWEFLTFVEHTSPKMVVIENVVGMSRSFTEGEDSSFQQLRLALQSNERGKFQYLVQPILVNAMHFGAPQYRPRLMLIALRQDIANRLGFAATELIWKSDFVDRMQMDDIPDLAPVPSVSSRNKFLVQDAIADLDVWPRKNETRNSDYLLELRKFADHVVSHEPGSRLKNHNTRRHSERVISRFSFYRLLLDYGIDQRLLSVMGQLEEDVALRHARNELAGIDFPITIQTDRSGNTTEYVSAEELSGLAWLLRTRKHSQKVLRADAPSRTVVTLPDDYGHPVHPRTFTVRELARFQGFPDNFEFMGKETTGSERRRFEVPQYTQVGNAVSPWQSYAVASRALEILNQYKGLTEPPFGIVPEASMPSLDVRKSALRVVGAGAAAN
ncbi:DNA cytosine methyltransferase [Paenarthrobacter ureafaciens]